MTLPPAPALVGYALQALVAWQARRLAHLRPLHLPSARLALFVAVADPARWALALLRPAGHHPYSGLALASWHVDRLLYLGWPVGLAAVAWQVLTGRRPWPHALGALLACLALQVELYPRSATPLVLPVAHLLAIVSGLVAVWPWARARRWPGESERIVLGYLAAEAAVWPLVWAGGDARARWPLSWSAYLAATVGAAVAQAAWQRAIDREAESAKGREP